MKSIFICFFSFLLASCSASTLNSVQKNQFLFYKNINEFDREYFFSNIETCSNLYTNGQLSILEVFCSKESEGIYIFEKTEITKFKWYEPRFNLWATREGCNNKKHCFYEIKIDENNKIIEFIYHFSINLSSGYFRVKIKNKNLQIIEQKITDDPS